MTRHQRGISFEEDGWELYNLDEDFNETRDLAAERPEKLREMTERWWAEAGRYDVMPLDDREVRFRPMARPDSTRTRERSVFYPQVDVVPASVAPVTQDVSHRILAEVELDADSEGTIVSFGNCGGGYVLYLKDRCLTYVYNYCSEITRLASGPIAGSGRMTLGFAFHRTGPLSGTGRLLADGRVQCETDFPKTLLRLSLAPMYVGRSGLPPVCDRLESGFPFRGRLDRVIFELDRERSSTPPDPHID